MNKLEILKCFFRGRQSAYVKWIVSGYRKIPQPLTDEIYQEHLQGKITISIYTITEENTCFYGMFDFDDRSQIAKERLLVLFRLMKHYRLPALIEPSGSKGIHLWTFFDNIRAEKAYHLMHLLVRKAADEMLLSRDEFLRLTQNRVIEIFPKTPRISPDTPFGFAAKLPWGKHPTTGKRTLFVDEAFQKIENQEGIFDNITPAKENLIDEIIEDLEEKPEKEKTFEEMPFQLSEFLPCFRNFVAKGISQGFRNEALFHATIHLKRHNWSESQIVSFLAKFRHACDPLLPESEFHRLIKSALKGKGGQGYSNLGCDNSLWSSNYCSEEARGICSVYARGQYPVTLVRWVKSNPPVYYIKYRDQVLDKPLTSKQVLTPDAVRLIIFEKFGERPFLPSRKEWELYIANEVQKTPAEEPAEEMADSEFKIKYTIITILSEAVQRGKIAEKARELDEGRICETDNSIYFRPHALLRDLSRKDISINLSQLWAFLRKLNGAEAIIEIEGEKLTVCKIPKDVLRLAKIITAE